MKETVSALMDGELEPASARKAVTALHSDESLNDSWNTYHLIGDALRASADLKVDVRRGVAARLAEEPTVLSPRRWLRPVRPRTVGAAAIAASVSLAAVVAWQQLSFTTPSANLVAANQAVPVQVQTGAVADPVDPYVQAHQEMAADQSLMAVSYR